MNSFESTNCGRPKIPIEFPVVPGCDMAGVVVAKGGDASKFEVSDEVYGNIQDFNSQGAVKRLGTLMEFVVGEEDLVEAKPENVSLDVQTAVEGFKTAGFKEGQTVFIVGRAVGVGTLSVQLANRVVGDSRMVATTGTVKMEFVNSLGANKVVDYKKTKYDEVEEKFDLRCDTIGNTENSFVVAKDDAPITDIICSSSNARAVCLGLMVSGQRLILWVRTIFLMLLKPFDIWKLDEPEEK